VQYQQPVKSISHKDDGRPPLVACVPMAQPATLQTLKAASDVLKLDVSSLLLNTIFPQVNAMAMEDLSLSKQLSKVIADILAPPVEHSMPSYINKG